MDPKRTMERGEWIRPTPRVIAHLKPTDIRPELAPGPTLASFPGTWQIELKARFPGLVITALRSEEGPSIEGILPGGPSGPRSQPSGPYVVMEQPGDVDPQALLESVRAVPDIDSAYLDFGPAPPPWAGNPANNPLYADQHYLNPAPMGIDVRRAWSEQGGDGQGIHIVDLEQGWAMDHPDLPKGMTLHYGYNAVLPGQPTTPYMEEIRKAHGTAVVGMLCGVNNSIGVVGIAPAATLSVVSQINSAKDYTEQAIYAAIQNLRAGDILVLEAQTFDHDGNGYLPVEADRSVFDAIELAVANNIIVVAAAGNGRPDASGKWIGQDLDVIPDKSQRMIWKKGHRHFRDSGAIMVGAVDPTSWRRAEFSNHGSRIDCFGWGDAVTTCWLDSTQNPKLNYTNAFSGTSSATPMIAGVAAVVQGIIEQRHNRRLTPDEMRKLLSDPAMCTASSSSTDRIGVLPDLAKIVAAISGGQAATWMQRA